MGVPACAGVWINVCSVYCVGVGVSCVQCKCAHTRSSVLYADCLEGKYLTSLAVSAQWPHSEALCVSLAYHFLDNHHIFMFWGSKGLWWVVFHKWGDRCRDHGLAVVSSSGLLLGYPPLWLPRYPENFRILHGGTNRTNPERTSLVHREARSGEWVACWPCWANDGALVLQVQCVFVNVSQGSVRFHQHGSWFSIVGNTIMRICCQIRKIYYLNTRICCLNTEHVYTR